MPDRDPPQVYVPNSWRPERSTVFVVRSAGDDPTQLAPSIRSELAQLDKTQPVYDVRSMQRVIVDDLGGTYLFTGMLGVFAIVALMLSAAGVYGLVSFRSASARARSVYAWRWARSRRRFSEWLSHAEACRWLLDSFWGRRERRHSCR